MKLSILSIVALLLACAGCGNKELSRNEAEKLITAYYHYPNVEIQKIELNLDFGAYPRELIESGYLIAPHLGSYLAVSQKGRVYMDTEYHGDGTYFATNMRRFKKITGIKYKNPDKTKAMVEYTAERYNITPFGKYRYAENEEVKYEVTIERYDDGWRITTPNRKNYTEADFPDVEEFLEN